MYSYECDHRALMNVLIAVWSHYKSCAAALNVSTYLGNLFTNNPVHWPTRLNIVLGEPTVSLHVANCRVLSAKTSRTVTGVTYKYHYTAYFLIIHVTHYYQK